MIKKVFQLCAVLAFALGILFLSIQRSSTGAQPSLAVDSAKFTVPAEASVSAAPRVSYSLPYPGILPDNPLYKLKMMRDRVWDFLTTDPVGRSNLFLLYADKRLGAGRVLIEGGKESLGFSTLTKGEKYLEKALLEAEKAQKEGKNISGMVDKLKNAAAKHEEVLVELQSNLNSDGKSAMDNLLVSTRNLETKVLQFLSD